jgi:hypothetical protein
MVRLRPSTATRDAPRLADQAIEPHIPVWDKGNRADGTFGRTDFAFDPELDQYTCPA